MSRRSVARLVGLVVVLVMAIAGVSVAAGAGTDHKSSAAKDTGSSRVRHRAAAAAGNYLFFYNEPITVRAHAFRAITIECPRLFPQAISGFFDSSRADVFDSTNRPVPFGAGNPSKWAVGLTNLGGKSAKAVVGIVCVR